MYALWEHLHANPEVSWEEKETSAYLIKFFEDHGFRPVPFPSIPGFYVDVGNGSPKIGLRADMDALLQEVNGQLQPNHSCGHDAHMAIVTAVMLRLKKIESKLPGTVRAIFQPAEELGNGSVKVVEAGCVDDLDYLFGIHLRPQNELPYPHCAPGIQHGGCVFIKGKINGADHHGARPHEGVNAIEVGHAIQQQIKDIHTSPLVPASIKMTNFHAGTENLNIIPGKATFGLDVRAQSNTVMDDIKKKLTKIFTHLEQIYDVPIDIEFVDDVPAAIIHPEAEQIMGQAIIKVLGNDNFAPAIETSGSDDFHFYTLLRPDTKATMLALGADVKPGLHHPNMTFKKEAMENGVEILTTACLLSLERNGEKRNN